ncbi:MAG: T9SS type A sorting domain-containing protein [Ignavibacteriales bacterium]|nr:hypothetical protein [Ignavibacteriaceae bacterium]QOJ27944.1 MAG: T9SS type A sorting domain-containing protein [Ignavibacteriales bacterium]
MLNKLLLFIFVSSGVLFPQTIIIDDFETGLGRFNLATTFSGSTVGILPSAPTLDSSFAAVSGTKFIKVQLIDNPADTLNWFVRFLSGTGSPANNLVLNDTGFVGYWIKTDRPYLSASLIIDDLNASGSGVGTNEIAVPIPVIGDGGWYLYSWDMTDTNSWDPFISSGNGMIQDPVTIDAIVFRAPYPANHNDTATIYLDKVSFNATEPLPVELVSFMATSEQNEVWLKWITVSELNNRGFEIERKSAAGSSWEKIGFVEGRGTVQGMTGYTFTDRPSVPGTYHYRLKQVDFSGEFEYSQTAEVLFAGLPSEYSLGQNYPNPFNPGTKISYYLPEKGLVNLSVFNMLGQKVVEIMSGLQEAGEHTIDFNADGLNSGVYIYTLQVNGRSFSQKMTLLK